MRARHRHRFRRFVVCAGLFLVAPLVSIEEANAAPFFSSMPTLPSHNENSNPVDPADPPTLSFSPHVDRGLVLPPSLVLGLSTLTAERPLPPAKGSRVGLSLGAGVGLVDNLAFDATFLSMDIAPELRVQKPTLGLTHGIVGTYPFELDSMIHVTLGPGDGRFVEKIEPGLALIFRHAHELRFDTGAYLTVSPAAKTTVGLNVPLHFAVQLNDRVYASVDSGVSMPDLNDVKTSAAIAIAIPMGVSAGYSTPVGKTIVSVQPSVSWPGFLMPTSADPVGIGAITVGVTTAVVWYP